MTKSRSTTSIIVFGAAMLLAVFIGVQLVTAQFGTLAWVVGGLILTVSFSLGRNIWMLIPIAIAIGITVMIPGRPTTLLIAQALFIGFCVLFFLMRRLPWRFHFTELAFWLRVLGTCILQV